MKNYLVIEATEKNGITCRVRFNEISQHQKLFALKSVDEVKNYPEIEDFLCECQQHIIPIYSGGIFKDVDSMHVGFVDAETNRLKFGIAMDGDSDEYQYEEYSDTIVYSGNGWKLLDEKLSVDDLVSQLDEICDMEREVQITMLHDDSSFENEAKITKAEIDNGCLNITFGKAVISVDDIYEMDIMHDVNSKKLDIQSNSGLRLMIVEVDD